MEEIEVRAREPLLVVMITGGCAAAFLWISLLLSVLGCGEEFRAQQHYPKVSKGSAYLLRNQRAKILKIKNRITQKKMKGCITLALIYRFVVRLIANLEVHAFGPKALCSGRNPATLATERQNGGMRNWKYNAKANRYTPGYRDSRLAQRLLCCRSLRRREGDANEGKQGDLSFFLRLSRQARDVGEGSGECRVPPLNKQNKIKSKLMKQEWSNMVGLSNSSSTIIVYISYGVVVGMWIYLLSGIFIYLFLLLMRHFFLLLYFTISARVHKCSVGDEAVLGASSHAVQQ
eukprot:gene8291-5810_t